MSDNTPTADYLPARMLNELTYCPRLFFYEHVEGVFAHNRETVEGSIGHARVDQKTDELPAPEELADSDRQVRSRSVTMGSDTHGVIAKMDLVESAGQQVVPVDYKRGRPCQAEDGSLDAWDADKTQLTVQALILRDNGYTCDEAIVYYAQTKQRVRFAIDAPLVDHTLETIRHARQLSADGQIPPPLVDSPKCPRCSLVGICLPDETRQMEAASHSTNGQTQRTLFDVGPPMRATADALPAAIGPIRRLVSPRDDLRPLYLNSQGLHVGKSGKVLKIKEKQKVVQEVRLGEICQLNLMGNIQLSTQAIQTLCEAEVPIAYFSMGGWFYGIRQQRVNILPGKRADREAPFW
jgi:CRISPR-associated protein Cas1